MSDDHTSEVPTFHDGERFVQRKAGVEDAINARGQKLIRTFMPDQHREFFAMLPLITLGVIDRRGVPSALILVGEPGFIQSPDPETLVIQARQDQLISTNLDIQPGHKIGLVGVELSTRRRNRMNGTVIEVSRERFVIHVDQSFGNCAKYIQKRDVEINTKSIQQAAASSIEHRHALSKEDIAAIERADTFFIASRSESISNDPRVGVDVSHRGGKPGFVRVLADDRLIFPDFSGNKFFNTLGNIQIDSRVGLLFPDFHTGSTLHISGHAEIVWDGTVLDEFVGAERLVIITVGEVITSDGSLALRGELTEPWPGLEKTGDWQTR